MSNSGEQGCTHAAGVAVSRERDDGPPEKELRWETDVDLAAKQLLFMPINLPNHWVLLVCDAKQRRFEYYDSIGGASYDKGLVKVRAAVHTDTQFTRPI